MDKKQCVDQQVRQPRFHLTIVSGEIPIFGYLSQVVDCSIVLFRSILLLNFKAQDQL